MVDRGEWMVDGRSQKPDSFRLSMSLGGSSRKEAGFSDPAHSLAAFFGGADFFYLE
jgi:hypothetical protein